MVNLPSRVKLVDVGPRDGLQVDKQRLHYGRPSPTQTTEIKGARMAQACAIHGSLWLNFLIWMPPG